MRRRPVRRWVSTGRSRMSRWRMPGMRKAGAMDHILPLPPHDLDAEASVIASMLVDRDVLPAVAGLLEPADFYRECHGQVFAACRRLFERHEPVNPITVADQLRQSGELETVGG